MAESSALPAGIASPSRRFLITLAAQSAKSAFSFLAGIVVARGLGPNDFGNLSFLLGSFAGIRAILDLGSSYAFFTLTAQRPRSRVFYLYYASWFLLVQMGLPVLCMMVLLPDRTLDTLWLSQPRDLVVLAFLASTMQYALWPQLIQLGEVVRHTHLSQSLTLAIAVMHLLLVAALHAVGWLTIPVVLSLTATEFLVGSVYAFFLMPRPWLAGAPPDTLPSVFREFRIYCQPLIVSTALTAASGWAEVWMLQHFGGAVAQAYYSLGLQFSFISLITTTALQNILWREMAELEGRGDEAQIRNVYLKSSRALLLTAAIPAAFLVAWTPEVTELALGTRYRDAASVVAVFFLYPIGQSLYTLAVVTFLAMRATRVLSILSSCYMGLGVVVSYFALAPATATIPGLGLGALGLSLKLVVLSFAYVLVLEYWIRRTKGWPHDWAHRLRLLGVVFALSGLARLAGATAVAWLPPLEAMIATALIFIAAVGAVLARWPGLAGVSVAHRDEFFVRLRRATAWRAP